MEIDLSKVDAVVPQVAVILVAGDLGLSPGDRVTLFDQHEAVGGEFVRLDDGWSTFWC
jgi:hypothetical protein